jgi:hypothetical protein
LKRIKSLSPLWILSLSFWIYGCASKPVEMIDKTEKAMQEAKAEHADFFAKDDWTAAEQAYGQANGLLQQEKWAEANTALLKALSRYSKAKTVAHDGRETWLRSFQIDRERMDKRYKTLKESLGTVKLTAVQKKTFEDDCKEIDDNIAKVQPQFDQGQFTEAQNTVQRMDRRIWEVIQELPGKGAPKKE